MLMKRVVVIGGSLAGYVAAIRAAQMGASVDPTSAQKKGGTWGTRRDNSN